MHPPPQQYDTHIATGDTRAALRDLQHAIREHQRARHAGETFALGDRVDRPATTTLVRATCDCSREVRVAPGELADGVIVCGICATRFRPVAP